MTVRRVGMTSPMSSCWMKVSLSNSNPQLTHSSPDEYSRRHRTRSNHFPENGRHSPTRVRVFRDGSVNVSTLVKDRARRASSSDLKLSKLAEKLDRIQRVRSGSVSGNESAITQKYKDRLRHAQEQFRRLERRYER